MLAALPVAVIVRDPHTVSALSTASVAFLFVFALAMVVLAATGPAAVDTGARDAHIHCVGRLGNDVVAQSWIRW